MPRHKLRLCNRLGGRGWTGNCACGWSAASALCRSDIERAFDQHIDEERSLPEAAPDAGDSLSAY